MANGNGLMGNLSTTQSAIIVKQPGNNTLYYVFTLDQTGGGNGARYSIVDMALAAGLGSVTVKNATLYTPSCEKQVAVRHCNGKDVWIVSHEYNSNNFRSYLLTNSGLNPNPVITAIGETPGQGNTNGLASTAGQMKISPDGKKIAIAVAGESLPSTLGLGGFQLFDFDASSGVISNSLILINAQNANGYCYGLEFSADGSKLYGTTQASLSSLPATLFQWDVCSGVPATIIASQYSLNLGANIVIGAIQRAINNKIYMAVGGPGISQNLHVINNPNASGVAMGFTLNGQSIAPKQCYQGLPNYINSYTKPTPAPLSNSIACQKVSFAVPPVSTFSSGCSSTPYPPSGYLWDFGETASGAANTSTLSNPVHTYSALGTYTVQLILLNNCTNDTLKKVVTITTLGPTPAVAGPSVICKGEKNTYTVSGGTSYLWSGTNATTATQTLSPTSTTNYTVSATANGCTLSKTFTVTVNPCTGVEAYENNGLWHVFPNPFKDVLSVEASQVSTSSGAYNTRNVIRVVNVLGEELISAPFENKIDLDMTNFSKGIYFVQLLDKNKVLLSKKVIKE
jgi:PKD repeat protein